MLNAQLQMQIKHRNQLIKHNPQYIGLKTNNPDQQKKNKNQFKNIIIKFINQVKAGSKQNLQAENALCMCVYRID